VPGLWAAGDAVSREAIVGGASGAGAPNAAWTISSGTWSGRAAAAHALARGRSTELASALPAGLAGLRPSGSSLPVGAWRDLSRAVQDEMLPPQKNGLRSGPKLAASLERLDDLWVTARAGLVGSAGRDAVWARETASMIAVGRWAYLAARARTESRAMHVRTDHPELDAEQRRRILIDGVDQPRLSFAPIADPVAVWDDELEREAA
jgi:succinate dehydrogenase/fumarate reductase flavoprotein subunit